MESGASLCRSISSNTPQSMLARITPSWGTSRLQSLRPKPGRSMQTVRHPSCTSSGTTLRQWNALISGEDKSITRSTGLSSGAQTRKCTRIPRKDRY